MFRQRQNNGKELMNRIMRKILSLILAAVFCLNFTFVVNASAEHDIFKGIEAKAYDSVVSGSARVETDNGLFMTDAATAVVYKSVDFYKKAVHMKITYSTQEFNSPRKLELRTGGIDGTLIAEVNLKETVRYTHVVTDTIEINTDISGINDLYLIDVNGGGGRIYSIHFYGMWSEKDYTKTADTEFNRRQKLLNSLDIISDIEDEEKESRFITRQEFAKALCGTFKLAGTSGNDFGFMDAAEDNSYINTAYQNGFLESTGGFIRPDDCMAVADCVKAYIELSGYGDMMNDSEKTREGYLKKGMQLGIMKGISDVANRYMTYGDLIKITLNTLDLKALEVDYSYVKKISYRNENMLEYIHGVRRADGIITANEYTNLSYSISDVAEGKIKIGNDVFETGNSGAEEYIGYRIRYYYSEDEYGLKKILYIYDMDNLNKIIFIDSDDIISFRGGSLSYNTSKNSTKSEIIPTTADVLYNGVSCSDYTDSDLDIKEGSVTFVDNNGDGRWEMISILSGKVYAADSVDTESEIIYPKSGTEFYNDNDTLKKIGFGNDDAESFKVYLDGIRVNPGEIKAGDILTVYDSEKNGNTIAKRIVKASSKTLNDYVKSYDSEMYYLSDGTELKKSYSCLQKPNIGAEYIIHITDGGKAAWFESDAASRDFRYGYVIKAVLGKGDGGDEKLILKVLNEDSRVEKYYAADKIDVDAISFKDQQAAYKQFLGGDDKFVPQLIRYRQNSKGELIMIDTANVTSSEDKEMSLKRTLRHGEAEYRNSMDYFWRVAPIEDKTVIFIVPYTYAEMENTYSEYSDDEFYSMKNARQFLGINQSSEGYDGSAVKPMGAIVKYKNANTGITESTPMLYITDTFSVLNSNDEVVTGIKGIYNGTETSLKLSERAETEYGKYIKKGDVWLYQRNAKGDVVWMSLVWSKQNPDGLTMSYDLNTAPINYGSMYICYGSEILDKYKKNISLNVLGNEYGFSLNNANITVYDKTAKTLTSITPEQIAKNSQTSKEQYVFLYAYSLQTRQLLIINE